MILTIKQNTSWSRSG